MLTALVGVVMGYLRNTVDTQSRLTESQDVQFVATYWQRDVASIGVRSYDAVTKTFPLQQSVNVAPACALPAGAPVVTLAWSEYASADSTATPTRMTVTYLARSAGSAYEPGPGALQRSDGEVHGAGRAQPALVAHGDLRRRLHREREQRAVRREPRARGARPERPRHRRLHRNPLGRTEAVMRQWRVRLRRPRGDEGALLIFAIIIITTVALVTGIVLTRGDGSLRATVALRDVTRTSYAADGAAQVAINALRTGYNTGNGEPDPWYYTNVSGTGCFGYNGVAPTTTPIRLPRPEQPHAVGLRREHPGAVGTGGVHAGRRDRRPGLGGADQQQQQARLRHRHAGRPEHPHRRHRDRDRPAAGARRHLRQRGDQRPGDRRRGHGPRDGQLCRDHRDRNRDEVLRHGSGHRRPELRPRVWAPRCRTCGRRRPPAPPGSPPSTPATTTTRRHSTPRWACAG
ncbi:hypothetical protein [Nocardioides convexus]|uniref:hypothetical protein n=1 Tax=Nocardioides convexus TaxID=2712224 RepID=UPI0024188DEF|nr:hypothetical protein [Nocardioides convexus]